MTAAGVPAHVQFWLAGNAGQAQPIAVLWQTPLALALVCALYAGVARWRRRGEEPIRREIRARSAVTFQAPVSVPGNQNSLYLTVHGDLFEVSAPLKLLRFVFGQEHCYRAEETTVEVCPGGWGGQIEIAGRPGTGVSPSRSAAGGGTARSGTRSSLLA